MPKKQEVTTTFKNIKIRRHFFMYDGKYTKISKQHAYFWPYGTVVHIKQDQAVTQEK